MSRLRATKARRKQRCPPGRPRLRFGLPDASLTDRSGLAAVTALVDRLGFIEALDLQVGEVKQRARGLSAGEFLVGLACAQLAGQATLSGLDRLRLDEAGGQLAPAPFAPPRTAGRTAALFAQAHLSGVEAAVAEVTGRWLARLPAQRRCELSRRRPTIDLDSTDVEVYGRTKRGVARTYEGNWLAGRIWRAGQKPGLVLAGDLLSGDEDTRPRCVDLLRWALAALPAAVCAPPVVRADAGFFTGELAHAAVTAGCDFAIAAKRNTALWRSYAAVPENAWSPVGCQKSAWACDLG
nr:transposase [Parafrankia sp. BMG5.11]